MNTGLQAIVKFPTGRRERGLVLSMERDRMRIALPGFPDIFELKSISGFWVSEYGQPFEIEGLISDGPLALPAPGWLVEGDSRDAERRRLS